MCKNMKIVRKEYNKILFDLFRALERARVFCCGNVRPSQAE